MKENKPAFGIRSVLEISFVVIISIVIISSSGYISQFAKYGYFGAFVTMFLSYATVVLPTPGLPFIFALGKALPNPFLVGILGGLGGTLGETVSYVAGLAGSDLVKKSPMYSKVEQYVTKYGVIALVIFSIIPNPLFDLAGISAGALGIKWWKFMIAVAIGTIIKATLVALAGKYSFMYFAH